MMNDSERDLRIELERRVQELSTLDSVSQVLRSTLNLDSLLSVIHRQVTRLLKVENFFVALHDQGDDRVYYPLAVKQGQRQNWPPRGLTPDRLTDRVIRSGRSILITPKNREELRQTELPSSTDTPQAWVGVPLITPDGSQRTARAIGCLALYSISPDVQFTPADVNLLTILSGQVSVAIENALLYEQSQRRMAQLEMLNRIMGQVTTSLDPQNVFAQVCRSVAQVGGGQRSAIYLIDPEKNRAGLAYAFGLSEAFATNESRTRALQTRRPMLISDAETASLEAGFRDMLRKEGIRALGDFPLITPDGQIGILSVYYDAPHTFRPDEVELLQTFASQAALAVSNARLYALADRTLAQRADQLAILEAVGRELAAAISSARLFEMILDYALQFTHSQWGEFCLYNARLNLLEVKARRGYTKGSDRYSLSEGVSGQAVLSRKPVYVSDTHKAPGYLDLTDGASRSQLSIPLIHEERVRGLLTIESARENAYSPTDQAFIMQLATQAAVAVVNAELYKETQRRLHEQSVLYQISARLVLNPELESVLQTAARAIENELPMVSVGVYLWDEPGSAYISRLALLSPFRTHCRLQPVIPESNLSAFRPALMQTGLLRPLNAVLGAAAENGDSVLNRSDPFAGDCPDCRAVVFPLVVKKQRLGMVLLHMDKGQTIEDDEAKLLHAIVAQLSLSVQNALLFTDVSQGRDRMEAILNSVDEGLVMLGSDGQILLANAPVQTITGLALDQIMSHRLPDLPPAALTSLGYTRQEAEALAQSWGQSQAASSKTTSTKTVLRPNPERVLERFTLPVLGQDRQVTGWMVVLRDVTEEHQVAEARELITSTLVHDLKSPLSAVLNAVDILDEMLPPEQRDELIAQAVRVARNSATRVLGLVESLLDIARLKSGRMELALAPVNLFELASEILADLLPQANEIGVFLRNQVPVDFPALRVDHNKTMRVLVNLLDNALKFTPAGGQIALSAELYPGKQAVIQVIDNGPGIPDEFREKIFDRFTQIPGQPGRRRGSGLGLTFCRLAVEAHGGRIWVEPRPGGGSIFALTLPLA